MRKVSDQMTNQMQRRLTVATNLLSRLETEENNFFLDSLLVMRLRLDHMRLKWRDRPLNGTRRILLRRKKMAQAR